MRPIIKTGFLASVIMLSMSFTTVVKAPVCSTINNSLGCSITVDVEVYSGSSCNSVCASYTGIVIPPGVSGLNCGGCGYCNVKVTVTDIGTPITPVMADFTNGAQALPMGTPCNAIQIFYDAAGNVFNVQ